MFILYYNPKNLPGIKGDGFTKMYIEDNLYDEVDRVFMILTDDIITATKEYDSGLSVIVNLDENQEPFLDVVYDKNATPNEESIKSWIKENVQLIKEN